MPDPTDLRPGGLEKSRENDLSQMIWGYRMSQAIFVAVKLGIIDLLGDDARGSGELAADAGADPCSGEHCSASFCATRHRSSLWSARRQGLGRSARSQALLSAWLAR